MPQPKYSDAEAYRAWLNDSGPGGYLAEVRKLVAAPKTEARQDWPVNVQEIIERKRAQASDCIAQAARLMREVEALASA